MGRASAHSVEFAVGAMATANGFPDPDSMTWVPMGVEKAFAEYFGNGTDPVADIELTGASPGAYAAPTVPNPINTTGGDLFDAADGEKIRRFFSDGITLRAPVYNVDGSNFAAHLNHPLFQVLASVMAYALPTAATDTVNGNAANDYTYTPTDASKYKGGQVVSVTRNGITEYAMVTKIDAVTPLITVHPSFEGGALEDGDVVRHHFTLYPTTGAVTTTREVHVRFNTAARRRYAFRCVLSSLTLEEVADTQNSGSGAIYATMVLRPGSRTILQDNANAGLSAAYTPTGTGVATPLQACLRIGDDLASTYTAPAHGDASTWPLRSWSLKIDFKLGSDGRGCDPLLPESGVSRGRETVALSFESSGVATYDRAMPDGEERTFVIGCGPADQGLAFFLPAGHLSATEQVGEDQETETETISGVLRQGSWAVDNETTDAGRSAWRLAFPIPDAP